MGRSPLTCGTLTTSHRPGLMLGLITSAPHVRPAASSTSEAGPSNHLNADIIHPRCYERPQRRRLCSCYTHAAAAPAVGSSSQRDLDTSVALAFTPDLQHPDGADFPDVAHVSPAARLQVNARNPEQADAAGAPGWLYAHSLHQIGACLQFLVGDPHGL